MEKLKWFNIIVEKLAAIEGTKSAIAERIGITPTYLGMLLSGNKTLSKKIEYKFSEYYGVDYPSLEIDKNSFVIHEPSTVYGNLFPATFNHPEEYIIFFRENYKSLAQNPLFKAVIAEKIFEGILHYKDHRELPDELK